MLVAGYGTFVTHALKSLTEEMKARQWYWEIEVLGFHRLHGWRRVLPKGYTFPVIIKDKDSFVDVMVIKTDDSNLPEIDRVEALGHMYDRISIVTEFGEVWIYVPTHEFLKSLDLSDVIDEWKYWIGNVVNPIARMKFPEVFV